MNSSDTSARPHDRNSAEQAILKILKQYKISIEHSDVCISEAEQRVASPGFDDPKLAQWQALPFITIDNPDSRDLDQALLIEKSDDGGYRVRYALADAAYYIQPGSELFKEALRRGVTYYTPLLAAPMLPESLSSGIISLNPDVDRRALVFDMWLKDDGAVLKTDIVRALICSQGKLSYESVQTFLDADAHADTHEYSGEGFADSLRLLKELGEKLIQRAADRDVIPFNRSETHVKISDEGISLAQRTRVRTEKYNEQISLLCNMQGAELLQGLSQDNDELQAIFRAHDAPLAGRLRALRERLAQFSELPGLGEQWRWRKDQSLADYVVSLPDDPESFGKVLAVERQILISNQASQYRAEPGRHHALAATSYARFSSPMREIVGIFTHKELLEALGDVAGGYDGKEAEIVNDTVLREQIIAVANQSRQTQKQINKAVEFYALHSLLDRDLNTSPKPRRSAIIMGFKRDKIYLACDAIAVDLKLALSDLDAQYQTHYELTELSAKPHSENAPAWQLGDTVDVSTVGFNKETKRFALNIHLPDSAD